MPPMPAGLFKLWWSAIALSCVTTTSTTTTNSGTSSRSSPPNILLFLVDDLGMGDVGCFGNDTMRTPNIDRIASEGVLLNHHLAAASVCTPSRAAFLTGRYPIRMGMVPTHIVRVNMFLSSVSGLPPSEITFAELAKQKGYATALLGKWHLGLHCEHADDFCHHPLKQGFDYYYGVPLTNLKDFGPDGQTVTRSREPNIDFILIGFLLAEAIFLFALKKMQVVRSCTCIVTMCLFVGTSLGIYWMYTNLALFNSVAMRNFEVVEQPIRWKGFAKRLVQEGRRYLDSRQQDGRPFLLLMGLTQVHTAMHASKEFQGRSKHGPYGDEVEELDWSVGQILDALDELGMKENTLVYFSSDNGGQVEESGSSGNVEGGWNGIYKGGKAQGGMDGGIRVPTVAMWPAKIPAGTVVDLPTSQMDVFSTLAAILNLPLPTDRVMDGVDIMPVLTGQSRSAPHEFLFHYCGDQLHAARYTPLEGVDVWKVHYMTPNWMPETQQCPTFICDCFGSAVTSHDPPLLYNIAKDPSEKKSLDVSKPEHQNIISIISESVERHKGSLTEVADQYAAHRMLPRPWLQPCCEDGVFPFCHCNDPVFPDVEL